MDRRARAVEKVWDKEMLESYDKHMGKVEGKEQPETLHYVAQEKMFHALKEKFGRNVVSIGSGPGNLDGVLLDNDRLVTMVDVSKIAVLKAYEKFNKYDGATFSHQDALTMRFPGEIFDTILFCNAFYYFEADERDALIQNCKNLLNTGGKVIVIEEFPFKITMEKKEADAVLGVHYNDISPDKIAAIFSQNGFVLETREKIVIDKTPEHDLYGSVFELAGAY